jgi:ABC-type uncharacterized transport system auxiliary subunit
MICLALGLCAVALLLGGCAAGAKTSSAVRQYALEYPSPAFGNLERVRDSIRVEPLSIARAFSTASMVYRSRPFVYGDDAYNRWKIKPSAMISDLLLRDMRSAGLFGGVFSSGDAQSADYALGGVIEELYEQEESGGSKAVLALNVTLLNRSRQNTGGRLSFQKNYRSVQTMESCDAESMARAVSKAMEALSREIILDTYQAMKANGDAAAKESAPRGLSSR